MTVASDKKYQQICAEIRSFKEQHARLPYVRELALRCGIAPGYISILLKFMEARGLVTLVKTTRNVYIDVVTP